MTTYDRCSEHETTIDRCVDMTHAECDECGEWLDDCTCNDEKSCINCRMIHRPSEVCDFEAATQAWEEGREFAEKMRIEDRKRKLGMLGII